LVLSMRALQHQSQDMKWKIVAIMLTRVSHGVIVKTENGESTCASRDAWLIPPFWKSDSLSGIDSGRVSVFKAYSRLRSIGETRHYFRQTRTILKGEFGGVPRIAIRADNERFRGSEVSLQPLLRHGTFNTIWVIFSMTRFLSEPDLRLFL
jgi:hypothetical protein